MSIPTTYFEWVNCLERFANGDDSVLSELEQGSFAVDAGTVYRFHSKVHETYVERKKQWVDKFHRLFQIHYIKTENDMSIVLQHAKGNLQPIAKFIKIKSFPKDLQDTLKKDFNNFVAETRKNIRESIIKDQRGNERLLLIINSFDFFESSIITNLTDNSSSEIKKDEFSNKRRIIF